MKSIYTFRSNKEPNICISFEFEDKETDDNIRDTNALCFLGDDILKDYDKAKNEFYQDDVQNIKGG